MSPVAEAKRITDFYLVLGDDQALLADYLRDPSAVLERSGLDDDAIATLLAGDPDAVRTAVSVEIASDPLRQRHAVRPRMCSMADDDDSGDDDGGDDGGDDDSGDDDGDDG
jgi:hypothetical protein